MNFQILIKLKDLSKNKTPTDMNNMQKKPKNRVPVLAYIKHPHYLHSDLGEEHPLCS